MADKRESDSDAANRRYWEIAGEVLRHPDTSQRQEVVGRLCPDPRERAGVLAALAARTVRLKVEVDSRSANSATVGPVLAAGTQLGEFIIARRLDAGGMSTVYVADQPLIPRKVALKVLPTIPARDISSQHFQLEKQALGRLQHPAIAVIYHADVHDDPQLGLLPWIAMELVDDAQHFTNYVETRALGLRETLRLFVTTCDAIAHAHQRAVVHGDIKPSNVLITTVSGKPAPKVIDFGIARLAAAAGQPAVALGGIHGTPAYMSPEQLSGDRDAVTLATDVYSLGVLLYELLTFQRPFDVSGCRSIDEIRETVLTVVPPRPSDLPPQFGHELDRELDHITNKAMARSPAARYASVAELAADIERHLAGELVLAAPQTGAYRTRKFLVKHRFGATVAILFVLGLAVFAGLQFDRARTERDLSQRTLEAKQEATKNLAESYVRSADLAAQRGKWTIVLESLDGAVQAGHADPGGLLLRKARACICAGDHARAGALLDTFDADFPGEHQGEASLLRGLVAWSDVATRDSAPGLIDRALESELSAADEAYANGLLATSSPLARNCFRGATDADPGHFLAWQNLLLTQVIMGQFSEAEQTAEVVLAKFPDDQTARVYGALIAEFHGDETRAQQMIQDVGTRLSPAHATRLSVLVDCVDALRELFSYEAVTHRSKWVAGIAKLFAAMGEAHASDHLNDELLFVSTSPNMPFVRRSLDRMLEACGHIALQHWDEADRCLQAAIEANPSSLNYFLRGMVQTMPDSDDYEAEEAAFSAAIAAEPMSPEVVLVCRHGILRACVNLYVEHRTPELHEKVVAALNELDRMDSLPAGLLDLYSQDALDIGEFEFARRFAGRWRRLEPESRAPIERLVDIEVGTAAWGPALLAADDLVERFPSDSAALKRHDEAVAAMRKQAKLMEAHRTLGTSSP